MDDLNQAKKLIENSQNVLIVPAQPVHGDGLASALALFFILKKMGKNVNVLIDKIPEKFQFLANLPLSSSKNFIISIDGSEKEISQMRYEKNEKGLKIYLALNKGEISTQDVSFNNLNQIPDVLIALGIESIKSLEHNGAAILNIGNQSLNGEVNLTDTTKSLAEISIDLINSLENAQNLIDENIATCLLTGIICALQNFRDVKTQPRTLAIAASLIEKGANHQKIIQHLYKQKTVSQIKILGKILETLSFNKDKELYCAALSEKDFQECAARPKDLGQVVEELKFNFRYLPNLLILWESHASPLAIRGLIYSVKPNLVENILANYQGVSKGRGALFLIRDTNLDSAKEQILKIL